MKISELLSRHKENNSVAIKQGTNYITYLEWHELSKRLSRNIFSLISEKSISVATFLPNSINYAVAYFAVQYAEKVLVPIDIHAKFLEILSTIEYCEIDLLITDSKHLSYVYQIINKYKYKIFIYNIETNEVFKINKDNEFITKAQYILKNNSEDDVSIMLHTSGTTSNPKRVMLTHQNLISNVESHIASLQFTSKEKVLISMPMFFGYCNTAQFLTHLYLGASIVIMDTMFLPKQFFQTVERERITNFTGVPSMLLMLLDYRYSEKYDYSSLRYICFGGGKMPKNKLEMLIKKYQSIGFVQTYGQTECSPRVTALMPKYSLSKLGSVGTPIPGVQIRVVDDNIIDCPTNEIGEIIVFGNNVMKGYYKQHQITNKTIKDGWVHTGDLGYLDEDGFLYLTGRIKNMIISGGINIYPEEIEQVLLEHDSIGEVCIIAEEHGLLGEVPIAKVVLKSEVSVKELAAYCTSRLADYKVPVRFDFVSKLSKTYNGKIKRH